MNEEHLKKLKMLNDWDILLDGYVKKQIPFESDMTDGEYDWKTVIMDPELTEEDVKSVKNLVFSRQEFKLKEDPGNFYTFKIGQRIIGSQAIHNFFHIIVSTLRAIPVFSVKYKIRGDSLYQKNSNNSYWSPIPLNTLINIDPVANYRVLKQNILAAAGPKYYIEKKFQDCPQLELPIHFTTIWPSWKNYLERNNFPVSYSYMFWVTDNLVTFEIWGETGTALISSVKNIEDWTTLPNIEEIITKEIKDAINPPDVTSSN